MTTSAIGRSNGRPRGRPAPYPRGGYTLLEICIVLFIVALLAGAAVPHLSSWLSEERLRGPARQIELLARTARLDAIERQQPYEVVVRPDSLSLEPVARGGNEGHDPVPDSYTLPASVTALTKGWGETAFTNRDEVRWRFQPSGLCEPFWIQFRQGKSVIALGFDPLTASIAEENYEFR